MNNNFYCYKVNGVPLWRPLCHTKSSQWDVEYQVWHWQCFWKGWFIKKPDVDLLGELGDRKFEKVLLIFLMQEGSIFLNIRTFLGGGFVLFLQAPFSKYKNCFQSRSFCFSSLGLKVVQVAAYITTYSCFCLGRKLKHI